MMGLPFALPAQESSTKSTGQETPPTVEQSWDSLLTGAIPQSHPDAALTPPQISPKPSGAGDFLNHFFFESRTDYWRYSSSFTGGPTATGIINAPFTSVFNPAGYPYPSVFQPDANRIETILDWGTRGWLSDRVNTHFTMRYAQDLTHVDAGSPAENLLETFGANRRFEFVAGSIEIAGKPSDGMWAGTSLQIGRQYVYGAELAPVDGASFTVDRSRFTLTLFGGRRFSFFADPDQRAIGGANVIFKLGSNTSIEYEGLWYVKGSNSVVFRRRLTTSWLISSYFRAYGGAPVDFSAQGLYSSGNGRTAIRLSFFQKLSDKDYIYDFTDRSRDLDKFNSLLRLNLGPLVQYSQFVIDARRSFARTFSLGGSVWVRRLNNSNDQGPFDTSFEDYRVHTQFLPLLRTQTFFEYHQRNSDRLSPLNPTSFDDVSHSGETSVKDLTGDLRRVFGEGRVTLHGGIYYRRVSLQDRFFYINGMHQSGWLAGAWWKLDQHTRIFADYNLDNDFFLFTPDLKNSRALHIGVTWKY